MDDNIKIINSDNMTSIDIIYDLMKIEKEVYTEEQRGHFDSIKNRFQKNKEMFTLAYDNDELIGYLCYFPISKKLHEEIIACTNFFDDNIKPVNVIEYSVNNYIYIISIEISKKYQGKGIGKKMMNNMFERLNAKQDNGFKICDILASCVTEQGETIAKKYNFELLKDMSEQGYKLMRKGELT